MTNGMQFTLVDDRGNKTRYDVLFTFDNDENGKSYIVYTDNSVDENGNTQVFASIINKEADCCLFPIESEREWKIIEIMLEEIQNAIRKQDFN